MLDLGYEIAYKRNLEHNYMIIKGTDKSNEGYGDNYRFRMLTDNNIEFLLKLETKMCDGIYDFYYETSGKQPLSRLYEHREIKADDLVNIILTIENAYSKAYEYMLEAEHFILDPKYMYINVETKELELLYFPQYEEAIETAFCGLAEYILDKVDHQDSKAVMLAYQLYKIVRTATFTLADLRKLVDEIGNEPVSESYENSRRDIHDNMQDNIQTPIQHSIQNPIQNSIKNSIQEHNNDYNQEDTKNNKDFESEPKQIVNSRKSGGLKGLFNFGRFGKTENCKDVNENAAKRECESKYEDKYEDEYESGEYGKTVMLIPETSADGHLLVQKIKGKEVTYDLSKLPVTIGKVADMVDIVLKDGTVSKIHAEIFADNEVIYIKDCNSTNGTFVNGLQLDAEERISLEIGDEISIGKIKLEFR